MFSWEKFLRENHIPYVTTGPNVARGNINIRCPFCGNSDPSEHMGLELETGYWGCWRDETHRGKSPVQLIKQLLHCSYTKAQELAGQAAAMDLGTFNDYVANHINRNTHVEKEVLVLETPANFRPISVTEPLCKRFVDYLLARGFSVEDIPNLVLDYNLMCCLTGKWENRIIIPIYVNNVLVTWTARTIHALEPTRYKTLSDELSPMSIKSSLFNYDTLKRCVGGKKLILTEGPFDALKMDYFGKYHGARATCIFGSSISDDQIFVLHEISKNFDGIYYIPDKNAVHQAMRIVSKLSSITAGQKSNILFLPEGVDDPGDLTPKQIKTLLNNI